ADLFGAHVVTKRAATTDGNRRRQMNDTQHTYLRLVPELRARVNGPRAGDEPAVTGERHSVLRGFEETDILPFGGSLETQKSETNVLVLLTFIPAFPIYPPETAWMRKPRTDIPALILHERAGHGRVAFLPADLDRRFARDNLPDHGDLLANLIRWAARDNIPLSVEGAGLVDCHLYRQSGRLILHLINLTSAGTWRQPVHEFMPVGRLRVSVKLPDDVRGRILRSLVSARRLTAGAKSGWATFEIKSMLDHEVVVIQ
ncbi:MAG TPA: Tat pathway signal protein, partial [Verrucomicrobiae bacterium]|nr:Tat pathway signal protein [Verrucomicrobiae bacterium]